MKFSHPDFVKICLPWHIHVSPVLLSKYRCSTKVYPWFSFFPSALTFSFLYGFTAQMSLKYIFSLFPVVCWTLPAGFHAWPKFALFLSNLFLFLCLLFQWQWQSFRLKILEWCISPLGLISCQDLRITVLFILPNWFPLPLP